MFFNILLGDGPAAASAMDLMRPGNAKIPCRTCMIKGVKTPNGKHYYVFNTSWFTDTPPKLRDDLEHSLLYYIKELTHTDKQIHNALASDRSNLGIKRRSRFVDLESLHFPRSFPIDSMHCILLNIMPLLFSMWTGASKLENHIEKYGIVHQEQIQLPSYIIQTKTLKDIGNCLHASRSTIPAYLGNAPRRIHISHKSFKAAE